MGAGLTTQLLIIEISEGTDERTDLFFRLGGDALPAITSPATLNAFFNQITSEGAVPASSPLAAGKNISWASLPNVQIQTDNPINGTNGSDTLAGTAANDVIDFGAAGNNGDYATASLGDDVYLFTGSVSGSFYDLDYSGLSGPITVTLDADWVEAYVEKFNGANLVGTDQLVDLHRAADWNTGDSVFFDGTSGNDVFNINMDPNTWVGMRGREGNDTFNIGDGEIIRIDYRGAPGGITANLTTGVIQDGDGGTDQVNVQAGSTARVELRGSDNTDSITGSARDERFILRQGNDTLDAGGGNDTLRGEDGDDLLNGGTGQDVAAFNMDRADATITFGADGEATVVSSEGTDVIRNMETLRFWDQDVSLVTPGPTNGADTLIGTAGSDTLDGLGGNDSLSGLDGADSLLGGDGRDTIFGGLGNDTVAGGNGRDEARLGNGFDVYNDNAQGGEFGQDTVFGGNGNDTINGGAGNDRFYGEAGNDRLLGGNGFDQLFGGTNADALFGGNGNDMLFGGLGADTLVSEAGADTVNGGDGDDSITASGSDARSLYGNAGNDVIVGGDGNDEIFGGLGNDTITGGLGDDRMQGAGGDDVFIFIDNAVVEDDRLINFDVNGDLIDLSGISSVTGYLQGFSVSTWGPTGTQIEIQASGDLIRLSNVSVVDINASDFIF